MRRFVEAARSLADMLLLSALAVTFSSCSASDEQSNGSPTSGVPLDGWLEQVAEGGSGLIANGDFSSGMDHWKVVTESNGSARGSGTIESGALHVEVVAGSDSDWDLRVWYASGFPFEAGKRYGLFFDAWSDVEGKMLRPDVNGEGSGEFTHYCSWQPASLGLESRSWLRVCTMQHPSDPRAWLDFFAASGEGDVFLDNVQLVELARAEASLDGEWVIDTRADGAQTTEQISLVLATDADGLVDGQPTSGLMALSGVIAGHTLLGHVGLPFGGNNVAEQILLRGTISASGDAIEGTWVQSADGATGTFVGYPADSAAEPAASEYFCSCMCTCDSCAVTSEGIHLESSCEAICPDACLSGDELCGFWMGTATGECVSAS